MHEALKIAQDSSHGLGLLAAEEIPKGSELIALPEHIPLRFGSVESDGGDEISSVLVDLARQVPGWCAFPSILISLIAYFCLCHVLFSWVFCKFVIKCD